MRTKIKVHKVREASTKEVNHYNDSAYEYERVLNQDSFWDDVAANYDSWENKKKVGYFIGKIKKWRNQSFEEFKAMVLDGADKYNTAEDGIIDLLVTYYTSFKRVVGYTKPSTWWTWANRRVVNKYNKAQFGGHIAHEHLHNEGLGHPGTNRKSVVYQWGYIVKRHIQYNLKLDDLKPKLLKKPWYKRLSNWIGGLFR